eukprot:TRINITY_DN2399_c0_g1_i9.p1 TRINITY_DN2399_c0_g1~~TRINITY_DN2399_c0_g1_i9.p1  ORF type:complete len:435 (-),score=151.15 TRINITY_DN2399_c0_g1_i9:92-1396(-)
MRTTIHSQKGLITQETKGNKNTDEPTQPTQNDKPTSNPLPVLTPITPLPSPRRTISTNALTHINQLIKPECSESPLQNQQIKKDPNSEGTGVIRLGTVAHPHNKPIEIKTSTQLKNLPLIQGRKTEVGSDILLKKEEKLSTPSRAPPPPNSALKATDRICDFYNKYGEGECYFEKMEIGCLHLHICKECKVEGHGRWNCEKYQERKALEKEKEANNNNNNDNNNNNNNNNNKNAKNNNNKKNKNNNKKQVKSNPKKAKIDPNNSETPLAPVPTTPAAILPSLPHPFVFTPSSLQKNTNTAEAPCSSIFSSTTTTTTTTSSRTNQECVEVDKQQPNGNTSAENENLLTSLINEMKIIQREVKNNNLLQGELEKANKTTKEKDEEIRDLNLKLYIAHVSSSAATKELAQIIEERDDEINKLKHELKKLRKASKARE